VLPDSLAHRRHRANSIRRSATRYLGTSKPSITPQIQSLPAFRCTRPMWRQCLVSRRNLEYQERNIFSCASRSTPSLEMASESVSEAKWALWRPDFSCSFKRQHRFGTSLRDKLIRKRRFRFVLYMLEGSYSTACSLTVTNDNRSIAGGAGLNSWAITCRRGRVARPTLGS
jgi:hypothetical protein